MKLIPLLVLAAFSVFSAGFVLAANEDKEMKEAAGIFDFSDLDVPPDPAQPAEKTAPAPPDDPLPAHVREVLLKWDRFQKAKQNDRYTQVKALRQVAAEILYKRAATDATARPALMEEAKRLTNRDPGESVVASAAPPAASSSGQGLVGLWGNKSGKSHWRFTEEGKLITEANTRADWTWLDEPNSIALMIWGGKHPNLIRVLGDRYESIDLYNDAATRTREKPAVAPTPAPANTPAAGFATPVLTKLAADEKALIISEEKLFAERRAKIAAFLRAQAKDAKGPAVIAIMEKSAAFDGNARPENKTPPTKECAAGLGADRLAGTWKWPGGKKTTFAPDGTLTVETLGTGLWRAANDTAGAVAIVLHDKSGRVATQNQVLLGKFADNDPALLHLRDVGGKKYEVRRTGTP